MIQNARIIWQSLGSVWPYHSNDGPSHARQDHAISPACCGQVAYADCLHSCVLEQLCKLDALYQQVPPPFRLLASLFAGPSLHLVPSHNPRPLWRQALSLV